MSSLRKYQTEPRNLLNNALQMYRSRGIRTAVVEGICDKRFLNQWIPKDVAIRIDGFNGKSLVDSVFKTSRNRPYSDFDFLFFFADVDFDLVVDKPLNKHLSFFYNSFCFEENRLHYNDLETYLLNTCAFNKVLANFDIDSADHLSLLKRLRDAARILGSLRAADIIVQKNNGLRNSVLNGLEVAAYFNAQNISVDKDKLHKDLPRWSNYKEHVEDLLNEAARLDRETSSEWALARGHDLTEMLSLYLSDRGRVVTSQNIELMLRLACEKSEFLASPMGKSFYNSICA
jgi:hypothetical protein